MVPAPLLATIGRGNFNRQSSSQWELRIGPRKSSRTRIPKIVGPGLHSAKHQSQRQDNMDTAHSSAGLSQSTGLRSHGRGKKRIVHSMRTTGTCSLPYVWCLSGALGGNVPLFLCRFTSLPARALWMAPADDPEGSCSDPVLCGFVFLQHGEVIGSRNCRCSPRGCAG